MKAKEKEMKDEKEDERQVRRQPTWASEMLQDLEAWALLIFSLSRGAYNESKIGEQQRRRRKDMRRWQKKCIENEWRG